MPTPFHGLSAWSAINRNEYVASAKNIEAAVTCHKFRPGVHLRPLPMLTAQKPIDNEHKQMPMPLQT